MSIDAQLAVARDHGTQPVGRCAFTIGPRQFGARCRVRVPCSEQLATVESFTLRESCHLRGIDAERVRELRAIDELMRRFDMILRRIVRAEEQPAAFASAPRGSDQQFERCGIEAARSSLFTLTHRSLQR